MRGMHLEGLPGGELVAEGLRDLAAGQESVAALLVQIGAPRLSALGLQIPVVSRRAVAFHSGGSGGRALRPDRRHQQRIEAPGEGRTRCHPQRAMGHQ